MATLVRYSQGCSIPVPRIFKLKKLKIRMEKNWYDRIYRLLLVVPAILLIFSVVYLYNFNNENDDLILKDVSLTGGTTITVIDGNVDINELKNFLDTKFDDINVRGISDIRTGSMQGFFVETGAEPAEIESVLEEFLGYKLTTDNSSIEFSGASLSSGFYQQLRVAVLFAFLFMAIVVFLVFRSGVPSLAVILSAFADIVMTLMVVDLIGLRLSSAGIIAFLMLIGYSVDIDILLTTRVLKKKSISINSRIYDAFKTGFTMTLTSIVAITIALVVIFNFSDALRQIFSVLLIGLGFDLMNTWFANASILKEYAERKETIR